MSKMTKDRAFTVMETTLQMLIEHYEKQRPEVAVLPIHQQMNAAKFAVACAKSARRQS